MRTVTPTVPLRVDYALTDLGQSLSKPAALLGAWASGNRVAIERAQRLYDTTAERV